MLSQQQYDTALANDKIKDGEIYLIPEEDYVTEDEFVAYSTGITNELTNIKTTYETKENASTKLNEAKTYAEQQANKIKNELLNGAGEAYDTLKELGELINENVDAIEALEIIATNKASTFTINMTLVGEENTNGTWEVGYNEWDCPGILESDNPSIDIISNSDAELTQEYQNAWNKVYHIETGDNYIVVYTNDLIDIDLPIQIKVVR